MSAGLTMSQVMGSASHSGGRRQFMASWAGATLADLLCVEDATAFREAACPTTGILVWPAIRQELLRALLTDLLYPTRYLTGVASGGMSARTITSLAVATAWSAAHRAPRAPVLIVATGAGVTAVDGRLRNRYVDDFAEILGHRAWTVEASFPGLRSMRRRGN